MRTSFIVLMVLCSGCLNVVSEEQPRLDGGPVVVGGGVSGGGTASGGGIAPGGGPGGGAALSPVSCSADGFCWEGTVYGGTFFGVHGSSASHVVAVGEGGVIATFDGVTWQYARSPVRHTLRAVWFESATRGWAVGDRGTVLEWDGQRWSVIDLGITSDLFAISGAGSTVYLGGTEALFTRRDGRWERVAGVLPVTDSPAIVTSIAVGSANEVYIVGSSGSFFLLRFDGSAWRDWSEARMGGPTSSDQLYSASICGGALVVSGNYSGEFHASWVQRAGQWQEVHAQGARSVCLSATEFLSFGSSYYGNTLVELVTPGAPMPAQPVGQSVGVIAAYAAGPRDAFLVGANGLLLRWTGGALTAPAVTRVAKVVASSGANVYRLTADQRVERLEGGQWRALQVPGTGIISDLATAAEADLWVVRGGEVHHLVGTTWRTFTDIAAETRFVTSVGPSNAWFSGGAGAVSWWNGTDVFSFFLPGPNRTGPVHVSGTDVYVPTYDPQSGPTAAWRRAAGGSWVALTGLDAWRIGGAGDQVLYTSVGQLMRWRGRGELVSRPIDSDLLVSTPGAVWVTSRRYEAGGQTSLHRYPLPAGPLVTLDLGTSAAIGSIAATTDGHVWVSTASGALLHLTP